MRKASRLVKKLRNIKSEGILRGESFGDVLIMAIKSELEAKYNLPVYSQWRNVPGHLHSRKWFENSGIKISKNEPPDAIMGGAVSGGNGGVVVALGGGDL